MALSVPLACGPTVALDNGARWSSVLPPNCPDYNEMATLSAPSLVRKVTASVDTSSAPGSNAA
ncbi:MAG: hypothetical protein CFE48_04070 [Pseudomonas sp. PGPPP2]|nr:MAG: hypothetical protein CFE48_04070 [Pseudomonas sp. PGPPP2]